MQIYALYVCHYKNNRSEKYSSCFLYTVPLSYRSLTITLTQRGTERLTFVRFIHCMTFGYKSPTMIYRYQEKFYHNYHDALSSDSYNGQNCKW